MNVYRKFHDNLALYLEALICILAASQSKDAEVLKGFKSLNTRTEKLGIDSIAYFKGNLFYTQITNMEVFFQDMVRMVVKRYPKKVGDIEFKLTQITEADSIDSLIAQATDEYLSRIMYKKPFDYLEDITKVLSIDSAKLKGLWPTYVEAKARRDLGIHNNWVCNETYLRKVKEAGIATEFKVGDIVVPKNNDYIFEATDRMGDIAEIILYALIDKYAPKYVHPLQEAKVLNPLSNLD